MKYLKAALALALILGLSGGAAAYNTDNIFHAWQIEEGSGSTIKDKVGNVDGSTSGQGWLSSTPFSESSYAIYSTNTDGESGYADTGDYSSKVSGGFAVEGWVYYASRNGDDCFTSTSTEWYSNGGAVAGCWNTFSGSTYAIQLPSSGWTKCGNDESEAYPTLDAWHHVALTYDGSYWEMQVDGENECRLSDPAGSGHNYVYFGSSLDGRADNFRLWDEYISPTEASNLMNEGEFVYNRAPSIDSTDKNPDKPAKGDSIDLFMNASDADNDDVNSWVSVQENGTYILQDEPMAEPSTNEFEEIDAFVADKTGVYYNITYKASDGSTNTTAETSFKLTDNAPTVSISKPSGQYTKKEIPFNYSVDGSDAVNSESISCDTKVNGNVIDTFTGTESFSHNGTIYPENHTAQSNSISVSCTDPDGNTGSDTGSFYIWRGLNLTVLDDGSTNDFANWSIEIKNSTESFSESNVNNPGEWEYDQIPNGDVNITLWDGSDNRYYFNKTFSSKINSTLYQEFSKSLDAKPENDLSLKADPGWLIDSGEEFTITASADEGESKGTLTIDGREVDNPYTATLEFGIYPVNWSVPETENYRPTHTSNTLQVLSTGFGATSNTTMAFKKVVNPTSNPYLINFSEFVSSDKVRESLGDVYIPHENITVKRTGTDNQLLYVDHSNYSKSEFNLTWGNYYANRSYPTTSKPSADTLQLNNVSYKQINPYYVLTYNLEQSGKNKLPPGANVTTSLLSDSGVTSYRVEDKRYLVAAREKVNEIETTVQYSATDIYQRNILPTSRTEYRNIWLVNANKNQVVELLLEKRDVTGKFDDAFVRIKKNLGGAKRTITEQYFDAEEKTVAYLINGEKYTVEVVSADRNNIRTIGNLYVDTVDLTKTIRIQELSSLDPGSGNITYNLYKEGTQIKFDFSSPSGQSNNVTLKVWNYSNGEAKDLLYENTVSDVSSANLNWDANASYNVSNLSVKAKGLIESQKFGDIEVAQLYSFDADIPVADIGLDADTLTAMVVFFITVTPMFFNPRLARMAAAVQVMEAAFFALVLGWIDISTAVMSSGGTVLFAAILVLIESWNESPASQAVIQR